MKRCTRCTPRQKRSKEAQKYRKFYRLSRWTKLSKTIRADEPLCRICLSKGISNPSQVVDHIIPHKGNEDLFWSSENLQAICKRCHDRKSARE